MHLLVPLLLAGGSLVGLASANPLPPIADLLARNRPDDWSPPWVNLSHVNDTRAQLGMLLQDDSNQYEENSIRASAAEAGLRMVFNVIWTFTKCNKDWVQYSMIARTQDIPSTAFIPTDAIPIIHYGVDPESTTPIGIYVYKTDLGEVKEFLGLASLSEGDLIEDWWPWALVSGVLAGGWNDSSTLDAEGLTQIIHALSGYRTDYIQVDEDNRKRLFPDYIDYADITPTFAYISVNGGEPYWVPVMTTEGKGDDRTISLANVWSSGNDPTQSYSKVDRQEQHLVWKEILRLQTRTKGDGGFEPTVFVGSRPGAAVDTSGFLNDNGD